MRMRSISTIIFMLAVFFTPSARAQIDAAAIAEKCADSIVYIELLMGGRPFSTGSGVIVRDNGVIVTNYHVIHGGDAMMVKLKNGDVYDDVSVVDYNERFDIAVIKVKAFKLKAAALGDSDTVRVGEEVVAIGNPLGLEHTVSRGIVSQLRDSGEGYKFIQIDAPISHGSSGGALFNKKSEVIGITSAGIEEGQNLNFALPINYVIPYIGDQPKMTFEEFYKKTGKKSQSRGIGTTPAGSEKFDLEAFNTMRDAYNAALLSDDPKSALAVIKDCEAQFKHPFHCNYFQSNAEFNINKNNIKAERHALAALDAATDEIPEIYFAKLFCMLGAIYFQQNDTAKTEAAYTQCAAYSDDPAITEIANANLIDIYLKNSEWKKIIEFSGALIASKEDLVRAFGNTAAGIATIKLFGDANIAIAYLQAAYSIRPGDPNSSCDLAIGYVYKTAAQLQASNKDAAIESIFKALEYYKMGLDADKTGTGVCRQNDYEIIKTLKDYTKRGDPQRAIQEIYNFIQYI